MSPCSTMKCVSVDHDDDGPGKKTRKPGSVPLKLKLCFGVGHVLNDLCSAMWFSYLLIFFQYVLGFDNQVAGVVLLIGQLADGFSTPIVGYEADRHDTFWLCRYGRRKTWHLCGSICVLVSFPFIFMPCIGCSDSPLWQQMIYYGGFVIVFQFGWACVQISHLSLIPDISPSANARTELTAIRYGFTVIATITVYVITWVILGVGEEDELVSPADADKFKYIVLISLAIGAFFTVIFHIGVPERKLCNNSTILTNDNVSTTSTCTDTNSTVSGTAEEDVWHIDLKKKDIKKKPCPRVLPTTTLRLPVKEWLRHVRFYEVAVLYMGTRLYVNMSQVFLPLYVQDALLLPKQSIAVLPLIMYIAGFIASIGVKFINKKVGRKVAYLSGGIISLVGCAIVAIGSTTFYRNYGVYFAVILLGMGGTMLLVTSLGITADLIGVYTGSGAFVYGAMSLTDKISNGVVVMLIQDLYPCSNSEDVACSYYKWNLAFACGASVVLALLALATLARKDLTILPRKIESISADIEKQHHRDGSCDNQAYCAGDS